MSLKADLQTYLRSYPTIVDYSYLKVGDGLEDAPAVSLYEDGRGEIQLNLMADNGRSVSEAERRALFERIATNHGTGYYDFYLVPAVGSNTQPMHPLMTWWAVLYTFSMLARYQPAEWANCIDVDRSTYAVPVERLLEDALAAVPRLIASTIRTVS